MNRTKTQGNYLAPYLVGKFEGLGEEIVAPWVRTSNGMRTQEIRRYLRAFTEWLAGGYGYLPSTTSSLVQVGGLVFPGTNVWDRSVSNELTIFSAKSDPVAIGVAWGDVAHLVAVEAEDYPRQMLEWWGGHSRKQRQFHALVKDLSGPVSGAVHELQNRLAPEVVLFWLAGPHSLEILHGDSPQEAGPLFGETIRLSRRMSSGLRSPIQVLSAKGWILGHPDISGKQTGPNQAYGGEYQRASGCL